MRSVFGILAGALTAVLLFSVWGWPASWLAWAVYAIGLLLSLCFFEYVWPRWRQR